MNTNVIKRYGDVWPYSYQAGCDTSSDHRRIPANSEAERCELLAASIMKEAAWNGKGPDDTLIDNTTFKDEFVRVYVEAAYHRCGRPTYLVSSDCYNALLRTKLFGISLDDVRTPFSGFEVRFADGCYIDVPTCLVFSGRIAVDGNETATGLHILLQNLAVLDDPSDGISRPYSMSMGWKNNKGMMYPSREEMAKSVFEGGRHPTDEELDRHHVCIALCLLATHAHDELFAPLLTKADQERSEGVDPQKIEQWHEKASRLSGRKCWIVGRHLKCPTERKAHTEESSESGRELKYQHWRAGHFHRVRHGSGHSLSKIMWFKPTLVRDDLPVDTNRKRIYDVA